MPSTSGSPTQNPTSFQTKAALSGVPVDQFLSGDEGWIESEVGTPHGPVYKLMTQGAPPVNGVTVLSAFQQTNARWVSLSLLLPSGSGTGLETVYQDVANGQTLFVLPTLPTGDVVMMINGTAYREGPLPAGSWTRAGLNITWNNAPFALVAGMVATFVY